MLLALLGLIAFSALPTPEALPRCSEEVARCAPIRLFVAPAAAPEDHGQLAGPALAPDDEAFMRAQLAEANRYHGAADLGFAVVEVAALPDGHADVATRAQRDQLGHGRWQRRYIDVYLVSSLENVDEPGPIRGVHWRSRADRKRRFIILSRISPPHVLAHELGHYFGLAHSTVPASLMNTSGNALAERAFQADELARIAQRAKLLFSPGGLADPRTTP